MKKVFNLLFLIPLLLISCTEPEIPTIDDYVGNWSLTGVGTISLLQYGTVIQTAPPLRSNNPSIQIVKEGSYGLDIGGLKATIQKKKICIEPITKTTTNNGFAITITSTYAVTSSKTVIYITEDYSGNWSSGSLSGGVAGSSTYTLKKLF